MSILTSWLASPPPDAAIEIGSEAVCAATVSGRGSDAVVQHHAMEQLQPGSVVPSLTAQNVLDPAAVAAGLQLALDRLGTRPKRVALVVPDLAAKVSLVHFEQVPAKHEDLEQLIRWQLRKSAPFPVEEACLTFVPASAGVNGGREFLVVLARREVVREYEDVCERAGVYPGLVDLSTLNVVNCVLAAGKVPVGDWLVIHMRSDYTSIVIMRGTDVAFFRNKPEGEGETLADLVHQTTMYYQDRLSGKGFSRVLLGGNGRSGADVDVARKGLEERLGVAVEAVDATRVAGLAASAGASRDVVARLSPLVGILLRTRQDMVSA